MATVIEAPCGIQRNHAVLMAVKGSAIASIKMAARNKQTLEGKAVLQRRAIANCL